MKLIGKEVYLRMNMSDYIERGYRIYYIKDIGGLVERLPLLTRRERLEVLIFDNIVMVKDTYKYDTRNPYI